MLEALYWVIERYKFAVNYVDISRSPHSGGLQKDLLTKSVIIH